MKLHGYFTDNAIIQADKPFIIKGVTMPNSNVTATFKGQEEVSAYTVSDNDGNFKINFPKMKASFSSYDLSVFAGDDVFNAKDILFGDVYFTTGQSNMEYNLKYLEDNVKIFNAYSSPYLRIQRVPFVHLVWSDRGIVGSPTEFDDYTAPAKWVVSDDYQGLLDTTGFGFIFGGETFKKTKRPIGIVDSSIGGSSVENWYPREHQLNNSTITEYNSRAEIIDGLSRVGSIFTELVAPLFDFNFKGMLWYLGESNCWCDYDSLNYAKMTGDVIDIFRKRFNYDIPVALINITPFTTSPFGVNYVNEQMEELERTYKNVLSIPVYDLPARWKQDDGKRNYHPIHPTSKTLNAIRTADAFYNKFVINKSLIFPYIERVNKQDNYLIVTVKADKPLKSKDGKDIFGFTIAGEDNKYYVANAEILTENTLKVYSPAVLEPAKICYAFFTHNNECNLFSGNLPVKPFRSDKLTNVLDAKYFAIPNPVYTCNRKNTWISNASPLFGNTMFEHTWTASKFGYFDNVNVKVTDNGVEVKYTPDIKNFYYVGVSPNLTLPYLDNGLHAYKYLNVTVYSDKDVDFKGFLVQTTANFKYNFSVKDTLIKSGETKTFTIDLTSPAAMPNGSKVLTKDELINVFNAEFTFLPVTLNPGTIIIKKITLTD